MKIFSNDEINNIRLATIHEQGLTEQQFLENVGQTLTTDVVSALIPGSRIVIFAGPELNGTYALIIARHLFLKGYKPHIYLFNGGGKRLSSSCREARDKLVSSFGDENLVEVTKLPFTMPNLEGKVTVIDGIYGSERTTPLSGGYQFVIREINETASHVISIDVPSGLLVESADTLINRNIVHANITLAIGTPQVVFFMRENAELIGKWKVVPVNYSPTAVRKANWSYRTVERTEVQRLIPQRDKFESKADAGEAIIFAGSYGMLGAATLATKGALRGGCGKVTVHTPRCGFFVMQNSVPCALFDVDPGDVAISSIELKKDYQAVAIGPGIGTADCTINALDTFLKIANANSRPVVLDADALNCISYRPSILSSIPVMSIITPHAGEFDRLFGKQPSSYARLQTAIEIAIKSQIIIILKGHYTTIIRPDGKVYINTTGTPALATGGTGDVLTGLLSSLIARGMRPELAAIVAPYIHGVAGELAEEIHGSYGVTASDVADNIGKAIKSIIEKPNVK